jgi:lipopolysaccharide transport system permease protein
MVTHLKELYRYRDLLLSLAMRDVKVRYRQTFLGVAWAVLQPLAYMCIFTLVFARFGRVSSDGTPYPLFSYTGLVPWTFFATTLSLAVNSIGANMSIVKKIYFPREVFPLGVTLGCLVDFLISFALIAGMMAYYRMPVTPRLLWLPWLVMIELMFLMSICLLVSAWNVFYRDVKYVVPLAIQLGLFVTPVIYSTSSVPEHLRTWYMMNPMAVVIDGFRRVLLHGQSPSLETMIACTVFVIGLATASYTYFKQVEVKFADLI